MEMVSFGGVAGQGVSKSEYINKIVDFLANFYLKKSVLYSLEKIGEYIYEHKYERILYVRRYM